MLNTKLKLHDIRDVDSYCADIATTAGRISPSDFEELHAYLIALIGELSEKFQPGGISFSTYAGHILRNRVIDGLRKTYGDTRYRPRPVIENIDDHLELAATETDTEDYLDAIPCYESLSPAAQIALTKIVIPTLKEGLSYSEIAEKNGYDRIGVSKQLELLREELNEHGFNAGSIV